VENTNPVEVELETNINRNNKILKEFSSWLKEKKLTQNTIKKHVNNMEFFSNEYLTFSEIIPIEKGIDYIDNFLGDFFIKKVFWSTPTTIKSFSASFKKFYSFLNEKECIEKSKFTLMNKIIRENLETWIQRLCDYENKEIKNIDDIWEK
jgi:site-specific recombinase XerD